MGVGALLSTGSKNTVNGGTERGTPGRTTATGHLPERDDRPQAAFSVIVVRHHLRIHQKMPQAVPILEKAFAKYGSVSG